MTDKPKRKGGFASMSPERLREISSKGGSSTPGEKRAFSKSRELARQAGIIGARTKNAKEKAGEG